MRSARGWPRSRAASWRRSSTPSGGSPRASSVAASRAAAGILAARLNVLPYTTRCVACQRRDEGRSRWGAPDASAWPGFDDGPGLDDDGDPGFNPDEYSVQIERVA